ncbi:MAG: hypothetical protein JWO35_919 [Candidatus Saccharibacteria bacterium]|nr:hypothetical protein [Candidatus Saccharibacteria bacterium]
MSDTIFTKIINGEIPCHKIYEDEKTFAFLDIRPRQPGHTLVIPKNPVEFVWDLPAEDYAALMATVQKVAKRIREVMPAPFVGEEIVGVDVPHAHVHLIPFSTTYELIQEPSATDLPSNDELAEVARKLAF